MLMAAIQLSLLGARLQEWGEPSFSSAIHRVHIRTAIEANFRNLQIQLRKVESISGRYPSPRLSFGGQSPLEAQCGQGPGPRRASVLCGTRWSLYDHHKQVLRHRELFGTSHRRTSGWILKVGHLLDSHSTTELKSHLRRSHQARLFIHRQKQHL